jgi:hypothetical protein
MESFLPLTVLGAIIGIYSILPDYKKLRLGYSFGKKDGLVLFLLIVVMLSAMIFSSYISYSSPHSNVTLNQISPIEFDYNNFITTFLFEIPFNYQFLIDIIDIISIIFIFLIFLLKFFTKKVHVNKTKYFIEKIDELFNKGEYTTVISLINDNYENIIKFKECENDRGTFPKGIDPKGIDNLIREFKRKQNHDNELSPFRNLKIRLTDKIKSIDLKSILNYFNYILCLIKNYNQDKELQADIKIRLSDYNFIEKIVKYNPYFGLKVVTDKSKRIDSFFQKKFAHLYFKELMRNKNSVLYREIKNTTSFTLKSGNRYEIYKNNKIIYQVLFNSDTAYKTGVYKPIGDLTLELLDEQHKIPNDYYNDYIDKLMPYSSENLNDPIFMVVHFFDIMIREALYQGIKWHMWLYYYNEFVKRICKNYQLNKRSELNYEFPSVYSALLYEIFSNLISWIELIEKDTEEIQNELESEDCSHENDNIIKSSIICLNLCIGYILRTNDIPYTFKEYLLEMVFNLYFDLVLSDNELVNKYGIVLEKCLLKTSKMDTDSKETLKHILNSIDQIPIIHKRNGRDKLEHIKKLLD